MKTFKSKKWLKAVSEIEYCVLCGAYGVQAAHRNEGKGIGLKVDDCLTAALCPTCHYELDNGNLFNREERREQMDKAIILTIQQLARSGKISIEAKL